MAVAEQAEEGNALNLKHGMYATDANLKEHWDEADEKLYEQIMGWAEDYGFEPGTPAHQELESLALSKVRTMRGEVYLAENGEVVTREQYNPETDTVEEWEEVHELSDNVRLKKQTILRMMSQLGLTPKSEASMGKDESEASAAEAVAGMAAEALDDSDADYDPEEFTDG